MAATGIPHEMMWTSMRTTLIQEIHKPHLDALLTFFKDDLGMSDIKKVVNGGVTARSEGERFVQQKRLLLDHLDEKYSKNGILKFLLRFSKKVSMNLRLEGRSVNLTDYLKEFEGGWREARRKARQEGILDEGEFIGREEDLRTVRRMVVAETRNVSGVFLCGMYGCGKTTLAGEVVKKSTRLFRRCFIDLKGVRSVEDLYYRLKRKLGMKTVGGEGVNWATIVEYLEYNDSDLLILLDGVEQLLEPEPDIDSGEGLPSKGTSTCEEMIEILVELTSINNSKVKLLLTSQLDIWADDTHRRYPSSVFGNLRTLKQSMEVYRLNNFSQYECQKLIQKVAPEASKAITSKQFLQIANACGCNVLGVQVVANFLRTVKGPLDKVLENIIEEAQKHDQEGGQKLTRVFGLIFKSLSEDSRKHLIQLSAFGSPFDIKAAMKVTGSGPSTLAMSGWLDVLIKRHLLEIEDISDAISQDKGKISVYQFGEHEHIRLSLHTLTQQFIDDLCKSSRKYRDLRKKADKNKQGYYRNKISKLGRQAVHNCMAASMTLSEHRGAFKECIDATKADNTVLPSFDGTVDFKKQYHTHVVMEWFLKPKVRAEYFMAKAQLAKRKGDTVAFIGMYSWYADTFFDGPCYAPEQVKPVLDEIDESLKELSNIPREKEDGGSLVRGHFYYVLARYHYRQHELDDAVEISRKCVKVFKKFLGCDLATARALNLAGSVYHREGVHPKESLEYHRKACSVLERLAVEYDTDIHFDSVMYYLNVGSQYHTLGNKIADKMDMTIMLPAKREKMNEKKFTNYGKALQFYEKSIGVTNTLHMNGTWNHIMILRNRCTLLSEMGKRCQSLQSAEEAMYIAETFHSKDVFLQIKCNSVLATAHCDMAEEVFSTGDTDGYDEHMFKAEKCFHTSAVNALKMGRTAENQKNLERLKRDYRRHLFSYDKPKEAVQVGNVFEMLLQINPQDEESGPSSHVGPAKGVFGLFGATTRTREPTVDDLPTPYFKKFRDEDTDEEHEPDLKVMRPMHVSWRDRGRRYWRKTQVIFEPFFMLWYRFFGQGQGQLPTVTEATTSSGSGGAEGNRKRKQASGGSDVDGKKRKFDDKQMKETTAKPKVQKIAEVFEENDSDSSSDDEVAVTTKKRRKSSNDKPADEPDEDAMSKISDYSTASTPFYEHFDELSRFGDLSVGDRDSDFDLDDQPVFEEDFSDTGNLVVPEVPPSADDHEPGVVEKDNVGLQLPYASYSQE